MRIAPAATRDEHNLRKAGGREASAAAIVRARPGASKPQDAIEERSRMSWGYGLNDPPSPAGTYSTFRRARSRSRSSPYRLKASSRPVREEISGGDAETTAFPFI